MVLVQVHLPERCGHNSTTNVRQYKEENIYTSLQRIPAHNINYKVSNCNNFLVFSIFNLSTKDLFNGKTKGTEQSV